MSEDRYSTTKRDCTTSEEKKLADEERRIERLAIDEVLDDLEIILSDIEGAHRESPKAESPLPANSVTPRIVPNWRDKFATYVRSLKERLQQPNASARKLRPHARQIAEDWRAYQDLAAELGRIPTATEFGTRIGVNGVKGWRRLRRLVSVDE